MKNKQFIVLLVSIMISFSVTGQNNDFVFGVKGGLNYSTYTKGYPIFEFKRSLGYFIGGYGNIALNDDFKLQAEILFANQGTNYSINLLNFILPQDPNEPLFNENFDGKVEELTIIIPILAQYYFLKKFYVELGPQLGFIVNRKETINKKSYDSKNYDEFDFGASIGAGFELTDKLGISARYFFGIIKRDSDITSSVLNFGINYNL